jgi:hypothetical protein
MRGGKPLGECCFLSAMRMQAAAANAPEHAALERFQFSL